MQEDITLTSISEEQKQVLASKYKELALTIQKI